MKPAYPILKNVLSFSLIVFLLGATVNHRISRTNFFGKTQIADGVPLPPPIPPPPKFAAGALVADGVPLPPPIQPPPKLNTTQTADRVPLPPPIQPPPKLALA